MKKVRYPGPKVSKRARGAQYFTCFKLTLVPGINEIEDDAADKLLALGVVAPAYEYRGPVPTESEPVPKKNAKKKGLRSSIKT